MGTNIQMSQLDPATSQERVGTTYTYVCNMCVSLLSNLTVQTAT